MELRWLTLEKATVPDFPCHDGERSACHKISGRLSQEMASLRMGEGSWQPVSICVQVHSQARVPSASSKPVRKEFLTLPSLLTSPSHYGDTGPIWASKNRTQTDGSRHAALTMRPALRRNPARAVSSRSNLILSANIPSGKVRI